MKIVSAANAMIANPSRITSVLNSLEGDEYFFLYDSKYKWSIAMGKDNYNLYYYPTQVDLHTLASLDSDQWSNFEEMVRYSSKELGTKEAAATFAELYNLVKERLYGVSDVLDDIISSSNVPF